MNVFEFIKEKRSDLRENTEQYRAILEPKFRSWSDRLNDKITNTLNNPWITNFIDLDSSILFNQKQKIENENIKKPYDAIYEKLGEEIFVGDWESIDQQRINNFAEITGDKQWIHINPEKAKSDSPFKSTIAHGFLTLAMIPRLTDGLQKKKLYSGARMVVNYGLNQVRFPYPVKSGARIRGRVKLLSAIPMSKSIEVVNEISIEVEGKKRFGCVAETVLRLYY
jgi:acyl dehydratase